MEKGVLFCFCFFYKPAILHCHTYRKFGVRSVNFVRKRYFSRLTQASSSKYWDLFFLYSEGQVSSDTFLTNAVHLGRKLQWFSITGCDKGRLLREQLLQLSCQGFDVRGGWGNSAGSRKLWKARLQNHVSSRFNNTRWEIKLAQDSSSAFTPKWRRYS